MEISCSCCGHVNGPSGFMECRRFLDWLENYSLPRKESGPWSLDVLFVGSFLGGYVVGR